MIRKITLVAITIVVCFSYSCREKKENLEKTNILTLEQKIGQMIMVGFRGTEITENSPIYKMIVDYNVGGVVYTVEIYHRKKR